MNIVSLFVQDFEKEYFPARPDINRCHHCPMQPYCKPYLDVIQVFFSLYYSVVVQEEPMRKTLTMWCLALSVDGASSGRILVPREGIGGGETCSP